jgi:hypothetical protein
MTWIVMAITQQYAKYCCMRAFSVDKFLRIKGILHSPVYTFFEKEFIVELNADVETGNLKLGNASTSLVFSLISNFIAKIQN